MSLVNLQEHGPCTRIEVEFRDGTIFKIKGEDAERLKRHWDHGAVLAYNSAGQVAPKVTFEVVKPEERQAAAEASPAPKKAKRPAAARPAGDSAPPENG